MERSFDASFHPRPAVDASATGQHPSWFLLDKYARFANLDNDTTAEAKTNAGRTVKFTFSLEPPPAVSHLFVHESDTHHAVQAEVVSSAKDLVLVGRKTDRPERGEYFVYQAAVAGHGRSKPSLTPIPTNLPTLSSCAAILPFDDDQFLIADLTVDFGVLVYHLHVFSSKTCVWSTRTLPLRTRPDDVMDEPEKVIALGGSVLGWVGSRTGIVVCDVVGQDPVGTRFIPLPKPNSDPAEWYSSRGLLCRDVAYCGDGFIKLVDMDLRVRHVMVDSEDKTRHVIKMAKDLDHADTILDSELLLPESVTWADTVCIPDGWKIRTCYRHISWDYWRKGHVVDVDDIAVHNPRHCAMLPEMWDEDVRRWTLRKLRANQPTLSVHGDNMVYLKMVSMERLHDEQVWMVGVDLRKKTVEMIEPYDDKSHAQPFMLSQHLNTPPSVEEIIHASQNIHLSWRCVTQNNLPLQQNMWNNTDGYFHGSSYGYVNCGYGNNQYPSPWPANYPQALHHNINSLGSGCVYPVNAQSMYPLHMVNTHGQQFNLMPLLPPGPAQASAPSSPFAPPCRPGQMAFRR